VSTSVDDISADIAQLRLTSAMRNQRTSDYFPATAVVEPSTKVEYSTLPTSNDFA
jgi:hypothetical protein